MTNPYEQIKKQNQEQQDSSQPSDVSTNPYLQVKQDEKDHTDQGSSVPNNPYLSSRNTAKSFPPNLQPIHSPSTLPYSIPQPNNFNSVNHGLPSIDNLVPGIYSSPPDIQKRLEEEEAIKKAAEEARKAAILSKNKKRIKDFLTELQKQDPLSEDRRWFDQFAQNYENKSDAVIDFLGLE